MNEKHYFVYILASKKDGVIYIGVTAGISRRLLEHQQGLIEGFTKKYFVKKLVYYEVYERIEEAIAREKQIKKWNRAWKIELIEKSNPAWDDLSEYLNN